MMRTPKSVDIDITNQCNLRCQYCYHFESAGDVAQDIALDEWLKFFGELNRAAVLEVSLAGGEPFCRPDFREIIQGIVQNRLRFALLSNGTLISEELAVFLAATRRCNYVQVSLDGSDAPTHESCRGQGNFAKALAGINNLKKNKIAVTVRVTIHRQNVASLEPIAEFLLEKIGLENFSTNSTICTGLAARFNQEVKLTLEEQLTAMQTLLKLNKKYHGRIMAQAGPLANAQTWLEMAQARQAGQTALPERGRLTSCGGVFSSLAVRADGVIVPCTQISHLGLGRINKDNLVEIWQNHPELNRLRQRREVSLNEFEFCQGCEYLNYCAGGCPATAYAATGSDFHPCPDSCLRQYLKQGGKLPQNV